GPGIEIVLQAAAVGVPDHGAAEATARPVVAGEVEVARKRLPVHGRAGHDVVIDRREADARDHRPALGQNRLHGELAVVLAVRVVDVWRDPLAFEVLPGAFADAVAGIARTALQGGVAAQISPPGLAPRARCRPQRLAMTISAFEPAEIAAFAW